jgi:hypothetical protein
MSSDQSPSGNNSRVVSFRRRRGEPRRAISAPPPVNDLSQFERGSETDDYRHRMIVNAVAFVFLIALIGAGLWLANTMASLRRNQDCALAGHRNCLSIENIK